MAHNLDHGVVTIGWDECEPPDLSLYSDREAYGESIDRVYAGLKESLCQSARDQVWRFYHAIRVGDLVVLPLKNHGTAEDWIAVGRVTSAAAFDPSQPVGAFHHRSVRWLASSVPKVAAPGELQRSIGNPNMTVFAPRATQAGKVIQEFVDEYSDAAPDDP